MNADAKPLAGVTIVDLSRILAGPFATQLLADLGADVHKIEPIPGDPTRSWGPPFEERAAEPAEGEPSQDTSGRDGSGRDGSGRDGSGREGSGREGSAQQSGDDPGRGESAYFRCANRGKTTEAMDLRDSSAREGLFQRLSGATVVVENFLPSSAKKLGLDPKSLRARFPDLIIASIRSFASDTEAADRPGYDFLIQAESGWMSVTGEPDGRPMKVGFALVDVLAGLYLANAVQAAVREKEQTGVARHVEVSLMESALAGLVNVGAGALMTGSAPARYGNGHPNIVPYQSFHARDGDVAIAVGNDRQFESLMNALGLADRLGANPGWRTNPGRVADRERVVAALAGPISDHPVSQVLRICSGAHVAAGPVRTVDEALLGQPGVLHRAVSHLPDPNGPSGESVPVAVVGSPIRLDGVRTVSDRAPPRRPSVETAGEPDTTDVGSTGEGEKPASGR